MILPSELEDADYADIRLVTEVLSDESLRKRLRAMNSSKDLYEALVSASASSAHDERCQTDCA